MSGAQKAEEPLPDDPITKMIYDLVKNAAALMLEARDMAVLIDMPSFQVLITSDFAWRKEGGCRGILFDVLIETAGDRVIVLQMIVPYEEALFAGTKASVALIQ